MLNPRKLVFRVAVILLMVVSIPLGMEPVQGQGGLEVENATVAVDFGKSITFVAKIKSPTSH